MVSELELLASIGFAGKVHGGLVVHPDDERIIYPVGSTVLVKKLISKKQGGGQEQDFLKGTQDVSCLAINKEGTLLATGQVSKLVAAEVTLWDLKEQKVLHRLKLHKGKVQSVAFSPSSTYLATLGGEDDNKVVIWDLTTGDAVCGATATNEAANCVRYYNNSDDFLVTAGKYNLRSWSFDLENRKIRPTDFKLGQLKRVVQCLAIAEDDELMYAGTLSGDVLKVSLSAKLFVMSGPTKKKFSIGVQTIAVVPWTNLLLAGGGDGTVSVLDRESLSVLRSVKLDSGSITSISLNKANDHFFVGTSRASTYIVAVDDMAHELRSSSHFGRINDVAFPAGFSEIFVTASVNDIRVWNSRNQSELLRIQVPNLECNCIALTSNGDTILSGWSDGKIRAFLPETGRLRWCISEAHDPSHAGGVTALVPANHAAPDGSLRIVSGGGDGLVRVWSAKPDCQKMVASLKEHKCKVSSIFVNEDDSMFVSAAHDGSCVMWDFKSSPPKRMNAMFSSTQFSTVVLHPDESQLLTTGTDRKITYWDAVDASTVRSIDGSDTAAVNTLSITPDGHLFLSGGADQAVRLWHYNQGTCLFVGEAHSGDVMKATVSPDLSLIVSVGNEGAIMIWKMPTIEAGAPVE